MVEPGKDLHVGTRVQGRIGSIKVELSSICPGLLGSIRGTGKDSVTSDGRKKSGVSNHRTPGRSV